MNLGFNSNVPLHDTVYHVQTEEHGAGHPYIDTVVLCQGQVLHRRSTSFQDLLAGGPLDQEALRARVERQHREILQALREGSLHLEAAAHAKPGAIEVKLRNPHSWLAGGRASLELEVCSPGDGGRVAGAHVMVTIEGAAGRPEKFLAQTGEQGLALLQFPLPEIAHPEAAALVIHARTPHGHSQLRYRLKPSAPASNDPQP